MHGPAATDPTPPLSADALGSIARSLLDGAAVDHWPAPPLLLALPWGDPWHVDDQGADVEVLSLAGRGDPLDVLCDTEPKPEWVAVGELADGWTVAPEALAVDWRTLTRDGGRLSAHPDRIRVRVLHLVARSGATALAIRADSGDLEVHTTAADTDGAVDAPVGATADGLRRLLGLATSPCPVPVIELFAIGWLQAALAEADRRPRVTRSWSTLASVHPAVRLLTGGPAAHLDPGHHLVVLGRAMAEARPWVALHEACAAGEWGTALVAARHASFCDTPMFARLVLHALPPLWALVRDLEPRCTPAVADGLHATLGAWGVRWCPPARGTV